MMTDLPALEDRTGLPEALRVLVEAYPRDGWTRDPGFNGLIEFWLGRHMMFRQFMGQMTETLERAADGAPVEGVAPLFSRLGGAFVSQLHGHHQIEDVHYFPVLAGKDSRVAQGFTLLDRDHHALDGHLNRFVTGANALLGLVREPGRFASTAHRFHGEVAQLGGFLERHLTDEEDLVVPVILKYGMDDPG